MIVLRSYSPVSYGKIVSFCFIRIMSNSYESCKHFFHVLIQIALIFTLINCRNPSAQQVALSLLAYQLQKWLGTKGQKNNYYYSEEICSSPTTWRLLLRNILAAFCSQPSMINMDQRTYGAWYSANKKGILEIINFHLHSIDKSLSNTNIKTPRGFAPQFIDRIDVKKNVPLRIDTIHSVKGNTFDAVLLLSTPDGKGKTGYWENWLNTADEAARIAYVACTRPRLLLVWGVSTLSSDGQRNKLTKYMQKRQLTSKRKK